MHSARLAEVKDRFERLLVEMRAVPTITKPAEPPTPRLSDLVPGTYRPRPTLQPPTVWTPEGPFRTWVIEASAALEDVFPADHAVLIDWNAVRSKVGSSYYNPYRDQLSATFEAAVRLVRQGQVGSFVESIRAETIEDLLNQAEGLCEDRLLHVAAGLAGGALETHLRHLARHHGLWGDSRGDLGKYRNKLDKFEVKSKRLYSDTDASHLEGWTRTRNAADHGPRDFDETKIQVARMIEGIRDFVRRVPVDPPIV